MMSLGHRLFPRSVLLACLLQLIARSESVRPDSRYYIRIPANFTRPTHPSPSEAMAAFAKASKSRGTRGEQHTGFDPEALNKFLEEYASKVKRPTSSTTSEPPTSSTASIKPYISDRFDTDVQDDMDLDSSGTTGGTTSLVSPTNDTTKRNKYYTAAGDERNNGWVTLDAIPWSKSKISKWQANPTTQGPWPNEAARPWDKPSTGYKQPWSEQNYPARPYESSRPWQSRPGGSKPSYDEHNGSGSSSKPWYNQPERPRPSASRPSYSQLDDYDEGSSHSQKWPPERPGWDGNRYGGVGGSRPASSPLDIITDNGPSNFPHWERPGSLSSGSEQRPTYVHHTESYITEPGGWHDRNDFGPTKFQGGGGSSSSSKPQDDYYGESSRPHFSVYKYPPVSALPIVQQRPGPSSLASSSSSSSSSYNSHPSSGDGQWVLLSTNRGYTKSRQRSIKLEALANPEKVMAAGGLNLASLLGKHQPGITKLKVPQELNEESDGEPGIVPTMTSKRQIRLTVLPSLNGTNTTKSHGGLLEVEKTFKTVDQSQREYEQNKTGEAVRKPTKGIVLKARPVRTGGSGHPSKSAVLAAVGAGMLPATMAMMVPLMLGRRRKREIDDHGPLLLARRPFEFELAY